MGLPQFLEYSEDRCQEALRVARGPCHPRGASEVPTTSVKMWTCLSCDDVFENGNEVLMGDATPFGEREDGWGL